MKNKVEFIIFSDTHVEDWARFSTDSSRLLHNEIILNKVLKLCIKHGVDALFGGDFFDNPKYLKNTVLNHVFKWLNKFKEAKVNIYCISGNHDQCDKNSVAYTSPSYINMLSTIYPNIINLDLQTIIPKNNDLYALHGVPYMSNNSDVIQAVETLSKQIEPKKKNIILLHTHLPGAVEPNGYEVETDMPKNLYKLLKKFDLAISGHIHKPQKIFSNTYLLGATHQQRTSDSGTTMGLNLLMSNGTLKFKPLNLPEFKYYNEGEEPGNETDFWIQIPKDIIKTTEADDLLFKPKDKAKKLAKKYLKVKGIKSKEKRNTLIKYLENDGLDK